MDERYKENKYTIYVYTSNIPNSGIPDSNVYIQLYGKKGKENYDKTKEEYIDRRDAWITKAPLDKSQNAKKFLPGQKDIFNIDDLSVGKIKKIRLTHDSLTEWHLKKIIILNNQSNRKTKFICNKFIKSEIDLFPSELNSSDEESENEKDIKIENKEITSKLNKIRYDLKIKTSPFSKQATKLDLKIIGNRGESDKIKLNNTPSDKDKEKFLSDSLDLFKLMERQIGALEKILVFCEYDQGKPCDWFFDYIIIDVPDEHLRYKFHSKSWTEVTEDSEKGNTILEIYPSETKKTSKIKLIYKIELHTKKNKFKELLLKSLRVQLFGDFGKSQEAKPILKQFNYDDYNRDIFHFHTSNFDLGSLFKIKLIQKIKTKKLMWYLDRIKIVHDKQEWIFPYEKWIRLEKKEIKLFEEEYRKSRKEFFNENKYSRTMSTLSHRLITEDSINDDSYDESFEEDKPEPKSPDRSPRRSSYSKRSDRSRSISRERNRSRDRSRSRERSRERRKRSRSGSRERHSRSKERRFSRDNSPETRIKHRNRSISPVQEIEDDLERRLNLLKRDPSPPKSFGYSAFDKIEDKFKTRYSNLEPETNPYDSKFESQKYENFSLKYREEKPTLNDAKRDNLKKLNEKIRNDYTFDDPFLKLEKKRNELYNIDEELETNRSNREKSFLKPKKTMFDIENDKDLNKVYKDFFNTNNASSYEASFSRKNQFDPFIAKYNIPTKNKLY